ncbi:hypothetical protein A2962_02175 [Candidatus Woesebacteria bacterium RIFCSPLOWO2_01_FULL_39_61]|uniref:Rhodanese domain-containing protein n=1 Tax=Candidatus Woesebacteria bacterium RIFCSPHIGHO2_02_FULL_39_13 TaxID=1802505 RepID=A0A1F7Z4Y5_9BACT|nr:MAG: hypothetical protein A2692_01190 [Candidatus Woesebacteria bacterium RIFCSPHIGHO2_01_FULL_39_95]OGM33968.1 MAG: hypothetical protein A3D01_03480 [Candidatus Woesebacteria bacterium RIFCSPHIGHO2_02_FULL_39_13]OGM38226.1 MAG: hypothetical protein A3E13_05590 [Candidatus Woesebacteria bacterium RIFCSPHIGHO2_12_FULL_40_20]OGM66932.1 MAG: hypothetical protein A2962_02175 [Candidatus Woesebacteria bacterium RIFCSPLOWO2_01_FULL_39_61]OGM72312.1 MAG: hypothetical protein A3H19_03375 [Candidatus
MVLSKVRIKTYKKFVKKNREIFTLGIFLMLLSIGFWLGKNAGELSFPWTEVKSVRVSKEEEISAKDLKSELDAKTSQGANPILINVHTPYEGEIEKTDLFIDYDLMVANSDKLPKDKETPIILYCKTGRMSAEALATLKSTGYKNIRHLEGGMDEWTIQNYALLDLTKLPETVLPQEGFELPISWGDIAPKLVELGAIDKLKFEKAVAMGDSEKQVFAGNSDQMISINSKNGQFVVDLLWALGLAQKSLVYEIGPMGKENKAKVGNFASTGGWTLARGNAMDHYNKHDIVSLTSEQQKKVMEIAENVYRPCCGNHTAFPDCNHGMAALAAIELMVSKGISDEEIYKNVLKLNSFWFPQNYLTIATYFARQGINWDKVDAKLVLSSEYSSGQGAAKLNQKVGPLPYGGKSGGSCGA